MPVDAQIIEEALFCAFPDAQIQIEDLRGDENYYVVYIVSPVFEGKNRIDQHKMVYAALKSLTNADLHALSLQTSPPRK